LRTYDICLAAVTNRGHALYDVPENLRTKEICLTAVTNEGYYLEDVPDDLRTEEIHLNTVANFEYSLACVPKMLESEIENYIYNPEEAFKFALEKQNLYLVKEYYKKVSFDVLLESVYQENNEEIKEFLQTLEEVVFYDAEHCGPIYQQSIKDGILSMQADGYMLDVDVEEHIRKEVENCK